MRKGEKTMSVNWDEFDKKVDLAGLNKDVAESEKGGNKDYPEIPDGEYEVSIKKMELKQSKKGDPMVSIQFKILEGTHKGSMIFVNQVIVQGFQIHIINQLFRSMFDTEVEFLSYSQYNNLICSLAEEAEGLSFRIEQKTNTKGFRSYECKEVYEEE